MTDNPQQNFLSSLTDKLLRLYRQIMQWLGFPSTEPTEPIRLLTDLCLIRDACSSGYVSQALPETLLQAFSTEALAAGDSRYIDRELQSTRLLAAVDLWRNGRSAMVAVTGPQGCGMTSFLRQMEQQVGADNNCRYSQLEKPAIRYRRHFGITLHHYRLRTSVSFNRRCNQLHQQPRAGHLFY